MRLWVTRLNIFFFLFFVFASIALSSSEDFINEVEIYSSANSSHVHNVVMQAVLHCEDVKRQLKDEIYIPEAYLVEKEKCVVDEFARLLVFAHEERIATRGHEVVKECFKNAKGDSKKFGKCMYATVSEISKKASTSCSVISSYMKTGLGRQDCEEKVTEYMVERFASIIKPKKTLQQKLLVILLAFLLKILPSTPMIALATIIFFAAYVIWDEYVGRWQYIIVGSLVIVLAVLWSVFKMKIAPVIVILILFITFIYNFCRRYQKKKDEEAAKQAALEETLSYKRIDNDNDNQPL